jgi:hypothetical protein
MFIRTSLASILLFTSVAGCSDAAHPEDTTAIGTDDQGLGGAPEDAITLMPYGTAPALNLQLDDCKETLGVTVALWASVRALVPEKYTLASDNIMGFPPPATPLVMRAAHCKSFSINGHPGKEGHFVQIGAPIIPPDGTGMINTYQLWFYTDLLPLHLAFNAVGMPSQYNAHLNYKLDSCPPGASCPFSVSSGPGGRPPFDLTGTVVQSPAEFPLPFVTNWWFTGRTGTTKMQSTGPDGMLTASFGAANLTLSTSERSALATVLGNKTSTFPLAQQHNTVKTALLTFTRQ